MVNLIDELDIYTVGHRGLRRAKLSRTQFGLFLPMAGKNAT